MFLNPARGAYRPQDRDMIGAPHADEVRTFLGVCPAHGATPLLPLSAIAAELGLAG